MPLSPGSIIIIAILKFILQVVSLSRTKLPIDIADESTQF